MISPKQSPLTESAAQPQDSREALSESPRARPAESHFELVIRVRHDEMAQWSQERLAAFFDAVSVIMAAKSQPATPLRRPSAPVSREVLSDVMDERLKRIEQTVDTVRRHVASLHESMAEDLKDFEATLASQSHALQSTRTAMNQTDDLVERVVEALEALQSSSANGAQEQITAPVN
ncbi:MAG TPA: hypothetical protein VMH28_29385 [Candidatus Acidoferrales bacterium]|nr:hypothetical protein [Candidatus Acidoferrales bacterium]